MFTAVRVPWVQYKIINLDRAGPMGAAILFCSTEPLASSKQLLIVWRGLQDMKIFLAWYFFIHGLLWPYVI